MIFKLTDTTTMRSLDQRATQVGVTAGDMWGGNEVARRLWRCGTSNDFVPVMLVAYLLHSGTHYQPAEPSYKGRCLEHVIHQLSKVFRCVVHQAWTLPFSSSLLSIIRSCSLT